MRLVCPNCGAQYEVPADVIPDSGRDVQCSSCGHTWFQPHPDMDAGLAEELNQVLDQSAYEDAPEVEGAGEADTAEQAPEHEQPGDTDAEDAIAAALAGMDQDQPEDDAAPEGEQGSADAAVDEAREEAPDQAAHWPDTDTDAGFDPQQAEDEQPQEADHGDGDIAGDHNAPDDAPDDGDLTYSDDDYGHDDEYEGDTFDDEALGEDEEEDAPRPAPPMRRQLDPSISELLREEAQREAQARASDMPQGLETQPDLGLDEPEDEASRRARESRARMARLKGEPEEAPRSPAAIAAAATGAVAAGVGAGRSRRDLLPDIEEINSTLRSASDRRPAEAHDHDTPGAAYSPAPSRKRGKAGRRAFAFILLIFAFLLCLYVFADKISAAVPALSDIMAGYVAAVDTMRLWLDGQVQKLASWLDTMASESAGGEAATTPEAAAPVPAEGAAQSAGPDALPSALPEPPPPMEALPEPPAGLVIEAPTAPVAPSE